MNKTTLTLLGTALAVILCNCSKKDEPVPQTRNVRLLNVSTYFAHCYCIVGRRRLEAVLRQTY